MKYTLLITQECNLNCTYCYIGKMPQKMHLSIAKKVVDFIFKQTPDSEKVNIGFFGGEPMLEFSLIQRITAIIENHPLFDSDRVFLSLVTNGTIYSREIASFLIDHHIGIVFSCDGPPIVQDKFRRFKDGNITSYLVEENIKKAIKDFGQVPVNAVFHPETLGSLIETVKYFSELGIRQIYLSPDYSAQWKKSDIDSIQTIYEQLSELYISYYLKGDPHFISTIDSKITVILRGGYLQLERCRMGKGEFAFTPKGDIYPCERLVGNGMNGHAIGSIAKGLNIEKMMCKRSPGGDLNTECSECTLKAYCMNWCGCSNFFATGFYNRISQFQCTSEQAAIKAALHAFSILENKLGATFIEHFGGHPLVNSIKI